MSGEKYRIGQVHSLLRRDFPELELSKIRYYEDQGLVSPTRTAKGYRLYSDRDVQCLREALRLVVEEFLPLKVVRERLIMGGFLSSTTPVPATKHAARVTTRPASGVTATVRDDDGATATSIDAPIVHEVTAADVALSANELLGASGLSPEAFNALQSHGLLRAAGTNAVYGSGDLLIARRCAPLLAKGADVRLLVALKRTVEREMDIVRDLTQQARLVAQRDGRSARAEVHATAAEVAALRAVLAQRASEDLPR